MSVRAPSLRRVLTFSALNVLLPLACAWNVMRLAEGDKSWPPVGVVERQREIYGAANLTIKLPGTAGGIEEPLLIVGSTGKATFIFIRFLPDKQATIGIEYWGYFSKESAPFPLPTGRNELKLKLSFPVLYPAAGAPEWKQVTPAKQTYLLSHYALAVDGTVVLRGEAPPAAFPTAPVYVGINPIGGSRVSDRFTGEILQQWRD